MKEHFWLKKAESAFFSITINIPDGGKVPTKYDLCCNLVGDLSWKFKSHTRKGPLKCRFLQFSRSFYM